MHAGGPETLIGGVLKIALTSGTSAAKRDRRRIMEPERDLNHKDKALAETAAVRVLTPGVSE